MAVYQFSALADGQAISFNASADRLIFDQTTIAAADLSLVQEGSHLRVNVKSGPIAGKDVLLLNTTVADVATSNFQLTDGSVALVGDNFWGSFNDDTSQNHAGGDGRDLLLGLGGVDILNGGNNSDSIDGGAGNDTINGNNGNDWVGGGAGNDIVTGSGNQDSFVFAHHGAANADQLPDFATGWDNIQLDLAGFGAIGPVGRFASGDARFYAGTAAHDADDRIIFNAATREIFYDADGNGAGAAQLVATLGAGRSVVAGDFWVFGAPQDSGSVINGTPGNDTLVGSEEADTINGLAGDDVLRGNGGADFISGGTGNDLLDAGPYRDPETGNPVNDADTLDGGTGDDTYLVRPGAVILADAGGTDWVHATGTDWTLGAGLENLRLGAHPDVDSASGTGNELDNIIDSSGIEHGGTLRGLGGNDSIYAAQRGGVIFGDDGNDLIDARGSTGVAEMFGGSGNDTMVAGGQMTGGAGADSFTFLSPSVGVIHDFASTVDKIHLDATSMSALGASGNFAAGDARFFAGTAAHDADDRVIFDAATGRLWYDADGNGTDVEQMLIANVTGNVVATDIAVDNGDAGGAQVINGTSGNDSLVGGPGNDTINGFAGNDTLDGMGGTDSLVGGDGNDLYRVDETMDAIVEAENAGIDTVHSTASYALSAFVNNLVLMGGATSGAGNEIDNTLSTTTDHAVQLDGMGGNDMLLGSSFNDELNGWDGNDSMTGGAGNDVFDTQDRSDGIDTMDGGQGDDRFFVSAGDMVFGGDGVDTVMAKVSWTLGATEENLTFHTGTDDHDLVGITGIGNALNNVITATRAVDSTLDGKAGNDTITGDDMHVDRFLFSVSPGAANADVITNFIADRIVLDGTVHADIGLSGRFSTDDARFHAAAGANAGHDADDRVVYNTTTGQLWYDADGSGAGAAQLIATLQDAPSLVASDIEAINGASGGATINGTAGNDTLTGTSGADTLNGLGGNDSLVGQAGADSLSGGAGNDTLNAQFLTGDGAADTLDGGLGDDVYMVHADGDVIVADPGGIDTVVAITASDWTLGSGLENLDLESSDEFFGPSGTGNALNNTIRGASTGGSLSGLGGNDLLIARNEVGSVTWLFGGDGNDTLRGGAGAVEMDGGAGDDVLVGDNGNSVASGGDGADSFVFQGSFHAIADFASGTDKLRFDGTVFDDIGASGNFAAGDARFFAGTAAHDADDRIIYDAASGDLWYDADGNGAQGATLVARFVSSVVATDIAVDNGSSGGSTINGTAGNDTLTGGSGNDTINGLDGDDSLAGAAGDDRLDGGAGIDTMNGGLGNDTYVLGSESDTLIDAGGIDTWLTPFSRALGSGFENLTITGTAIADASGNSAANVLIGNSANNTLRGRDGNDTLTGGGGNDFFDFVTAPSAANADTITDFATVDQLRFEDFVHAGIGATGTWSATDARFWASAEGTAHDATDRVIYNTSTGQLYYDADGNGAGAAQLVATLQGAPTLSANDITVI